MADATTPQQPVTVPVQAVPLSINPGQNLLDQTLGDLLQNNPQAQHMITQSMGITQENFQQMLASAQQNNLMHMKISDLFKNGIVQQAQGVVVQGQPMQVNPQQMQQIMQGMNGQEVQIQQPGQQQNAQDPNKLQYTLPNNSKKTWWKKLLGL